MYWATTKVFRKREQLEPQQSWRKNKTVSFALNGREERGVEELGRKERKKQDKTRITNILTNEKVVVLQTKVNSGLLGGRN